MENERYTVPSASPKELVRFAQTSKYVVLVFPDFVEKERYASQWLTEKRGGISKTKINHLSSFSYLVEAKLSWCVFLISLQENRKRDINEP